MKNWKTILIGMLWGACGALLVFSIVFGVRELGNFCYDEGKKAAELEIAAENQNVPQCDLEVYINRNLYICPECGKGLTEFASHGPSAACGQLRCYNCEWAGSEVEIEEGGEASEQWCLEQAKQSYWDTYGSPVDVLNRIIKTRAEGQND